MKAWPIDPLAFRDLKLEVSEKLLPVVALEATRRGGLVGVLGLCIRPPHAGDMSKLRGPPESARVPTGRGNAVGAAT